MADPVSLVHSIVNVAVTLRAAVNQAKANRKQSARLQSRVDAIVAALQTADAAALIDSPQFRTALNNLSECIKKCSALVSKFTSANFVMRVVKGGAHRDKFLQMNSELCQCNSDLTVCVNIVNVQQIFMTAEDEVDARADAIDLESRYVEIINGIKQIDDDNMRREGKIDQMMDMMARRIQSFKQQFRARIKSDKQQESIPTSSASDEFTFTRIAFTELLFEDRLGAGSFGDVYRGVWQTMDKTVAIKVLRCTEFTDDVKQEFMNELQIMNNIRGYDHVISLQGACLEAGNYCIVMEYLSRGSLYDVLHSPKVVLPWSLRWDIAYQCANAINFLHHLQPKCVLHRDIKSFNFLVDEHFRVKVCDFGLSRARSESSMRSVRPPISSAVGSLRWMAPELMQGFGRTYSKACDVFSLGVVLWEIATRRIPYDEIDDDASIREGVKSGYRLNIPADVPATFADLIRQCWVHADDERPSISEVLRILKLKGTSVCQGLAERTNSDPHLPTTSAPTSTMLSELTNANQSYAAATETRNVQILPAVLIEPAANDKHSSRNDGLIDIYPESLSLRSWTSGYKLVKISNHDGFVYVTPNELLPNKTQPLVNMLFYEMKESDAWLQYKLCNDSSKCTCFTPLRSRLLRGSVISEISVCDCACLASHQFSVAYIRCCTLFNFTAIPTDAMDGVIISHDADSGPVREVMTIPSSTDKRFVKRHCLFLGGLVMLPFVFCMPEGKRDVQFNLHVRLVRRTSTVDEALRYLYEWRQS